MTFGDSIRTLGDVLELGPQNVLPAVALLAFMFLLNDLIRTWWMTQATRSVVAHVAICLLTLAPAVTLAVVLWWAGWHHPHRVWHNLVIAAALYLPWWAGGALTRWVRADSEGADLGWIAMGAAITFPAGLGAAVVLG